MASLPLINVVTHGAGTPLVLFHGWGFDHRIWQDLPPRYRYYYVDLPGFGSSALLSWESFKFELLKQLPERFAVAGWSLGGLFATRLAAEEPDRVTHLVNIASSPCFVQKENWPGIETCVFEAFHTNLVSDPQKTIADFLKLQGASETSIQVPQLEGLKAGLDVLTQWDLRHYLIQLNQPVCYMFGRLDKIVPYHVMAVLQKDYPHFNCILMRKSAHTPFLSHQNEFMDVLESHIR